MLSAGSASRLVVASVPVILDNRCLAQACHTDTVTGTTNTVMSPTSCAAGRSSSARFWGMSGAGRTFIAKLIGQVGSARREPCTTPTLTHSHAHLTARRELSTTLTHTHTPTELFADLVVVGIALQVSAALKYLSWETLGLVIVEFVSFFQCW